MILIIFLLGLVSVILLIYLLMTISKLTENITKNWEDTADNLSEQFSYQLDLAQKNHSIDLSHHINHLQTDIYTQLNDIRDMLHQGLTDNRDSLDKRLDMMTQNVLESLKTVKDSNEKSLNEIRQTVEEKLEQTLQQRLRASFETVSKQLESVNKGLGEMKTVAQDVGTLNKVLSNTKTRGILGELQLGQIIEDIMTPNQYEREFSIVSGSSDRVEYAIKLPGSTQDSYVYLPIDSKFPLDDYYRLEKAYDTGDKDQIEHYRKSLLNRIKRFAKDINHKYLKPPETTNFGIMFLPTEGLYSEIVRNASFFDSLRRDENIVVAGPSTLSALLNSLSVGFKTLNLQRNANDISKILGNVKIEFEKFGNLLAKAQKQINTANHTLDSLITTRTKAIIRALNTVESYQDQATKQLLDFPLLEDEDNHEN